MAKKLVEIVAVNTIGHNGTDYLPGQTLSVDTKEAERLIGLGAACYPVEAEKLTELALADNSELLAAIASAETIEALLALMPENEPDAAVVAAFESRMNELEQQ